MRVPGGFWRRPTGRTYAYNLDLGEHYYAPMTSYLETERAYRYLKLVAHLKSIFLSPFVFLEVPAQVPSLTGKACCIKALKNYPFLFIA